MAQVVVVGAGQAGASCVARLRAKGYEGRIILIGDEPVAPYQRPPLSKAYLLGEMEMERLLLRSPEFYADNNIELRLGQPVTTLDPVEKTVTVGAEKIVYDDLVLATGSIPRRLPAAVGGDLKGVYTVRTLADIDGARHEFQPGRHLVVIGGGYIGLEAAAVSAKLGLTVHVVEMAPRILQRVAAPETSAYFRNLHSQKGVVILEGTGLDRLSGKDGHVTEAKLTDGRVLKADFVIAGVGIVPDTRLAEAAGLAVENGIRVDAQGRTSDPHVWAAGDCASFPLGEARLRLESVGNAIDMGELVADNILGAETAYEPKPWFWSDQYDTKLQIAGLNTGYDRIVTRGPEGEAVSYWYYKGGRLIAVDAMNDSRAYMVGKRLIEGGKSPDPTLIADPGTDLKALLKA